MAHGNASQLSANNSRMVRSTQQKEERKFIEKCERYVNVQHIDKVQMFIMLLIFLCEFLTSSAFLRAAKKVFETSSSGFQRFGRPERGNINE